MLLNPDQIALMIEILEGFANSSRNPLPEKEQTLLNSLKAYAGTLFLDHT